jgi:hypothetical protein
MRGESKKIEAERLRRVHRNWNGLEVALIVEVERIS